MLVSLVSAVARKMLYRSRKSVLLNFFDIRSPHLCHRVGVRAECASICYGIAEVIVYIYYRGKGPVSPDARALRTADLAEPSRLFCIPRRRNLHGSAEHSSADYHAVSACFEVRGDKHRDFRIFLHFLRCGNTHFRAHRPAHKSAGTHFFADKRQYYSSSEYVTRQKS